MGKYMAGFIFCLAFAASVTFVAWLLFGPKTVGPIAVHKPPNEVVSAIPEKFINVIKSRQVCLNGVVYYMMYAHREGYMSVRLNPDGSVEQCDLEEEADDPEG